MWYTNVSFSSTVPLLGLFSFAPLLGRSSAVPRTPWGPPTLGQVLVLALTLVVASFFQLFAGYLEMSCIFQCVFFVL